jgi:hypothetical protein
MPQGKFWPGLTSAQRSGCVSGVKVHGSGFASYPALAPSFWIRYHLRMTEREWVDARFETSNPGEDGPDFQNYMKRTLHVSVAIELSESDTLQRVCSFLLQSVGAGATAVVGEKLVDLVALHVRKWLDGRSTPEQVKLYDGDNNLLKIVKRTKE